MFRLDSKKEKEVVDWVICREVLFLRVLGFGKKVIGAGACEEKRGRSWVVQKQGGKNEPGCANSDVRRGVRVLPKKGAIKNKKWEKKKQLKRHV